MRRALTIKMKGGLGNQLFQYATGRALCIKYNISQVFFDIENYYDESLERKFSLSNFKIKGRVIKTKYFQNLFNSNTR